MLFILLLYWSHLQCLLPGKILCLVGWLKVKDCLDAARATSRQLDSLTDWLRHMETFLSTQNTQLIPENLPIVEQLLQNHAVCAVFPLVIEWR